MSNIVLTRIDSRLIHGQVMTKWVNQSQANRIIIVSDELAQDEFMLSIYLMSAPEGLKIDCYSEEQAILEFEKNQFGNGNILLLIPSLEVLDNIVSKGVVVNEIQIGGLGGAPNRKVVFQNITLDDNDVERLERLATCDIKVYFQVIPEDSKQSLEKIITKYKS